MGSKKRRAAHPPVSPMASTAALRKRAAGAAARLRPQQMPLLLDAIAARTQSLSTREDPEWRLWEQLHEAANGHPVGAELAAKARSAGTTVEEMVSRFRAERDLDPTEIDGQLATANAISAYHQLSALAVRDRYAYFCGDEAATLVQAGSTPDLLQSSLAADELPSVTGIAYFWRTGASPQILLWAAHGEVVQAALRTADELSHWLTEDGRRTEAGDILYPAMDFVQAALSPEGTDDSIRLADGLRAARFSNADGQDAVGDPASALTHLLALSHMIRQERLIDVRDESVRTPGPPDRRGRSRSRVDTITYLSYRARPKSNTAHGSTKRAYSHRWLVRGHWRRQWYPSIQRHVPIWITDYIAGPDEAPLVVTDKVALPRGVPPASPVHRQQPRRRGATTAMKPNPPNYITCPNCGERRDVSGRYTSPANQEQDRRRWKEEHESAKCAASGGDARE